jgi:hypothetical protein
MADLFTDDIRRRVQDLVDQDVSCGPITIWKSIKAILVEASIAYEIDNVPPTVVLCHPHNRGKLGINPFTAHRTGARIISVGCDKDELDKAVSIEISPHADSKKAQLDFNKALVDRSQGLMAPSSRRSGT